MSIFYKKQINFAKKCKRKRTVRETGKQSNLLSHENIWILINYLLQRQKELAENLVFLVWETEVEGTYWAQEMRISHFWFPVPYQSHSKFWIINIRNYEPMEKQRVVVGMSVIIDPSAVWLVYL